MKKASGSPEVSVRPEAGQARGRATRDRCWTVPMKDGGVLHVRAGKRPTGKTLEALQDLFAAAYRLLVGGRI